MQIGANLRSSEDRCHGASGNVPSPKAQATPTHMRPENVLDPGGSSDAQPGSWRHGGPWWGRGTSLALLDASNALPSGDNPKGPWTLSLEGTIAPR